MLSRKNQQNLIPGSRVEEIESSIGLAPGCPAYYGGGLDVAESDSPVPEIQVDHMNTGLGYPPGSDEYWGRAIEKLDPEVSELGGGLGYGIEDIPVVGDPPGSEEYFGLDGITEPISE